MINYRETIHGIGTTGNARTTEAVRRAPLKALAEHYGINLKILIK